LTDTSTLEELDHAMAHPEAGEKSLILLAAATITGAIIGGAIGLLPLFSLFLVSMGAALGATSGFVSMLVGLFAYWSTQDLALPKFRWGLVTTSAAVGASFTMWALLSMIPVEAIGPLVVITFAVSGFAAATVYKRLDRKCDAIVV
jgi:hypothetical protein